MFIIGFESQSSRPSEESGPTNTHNYSEPWYSQCIYNATVPELLTSDTLIGSLHSKQAFILREQSIINIPFCAVQYYYT